MKTIELNLTNYVDPKVIAFTGRENGKNALKRAKEKDGFIFSGLTTHDRVTVIIPTRFITMNKSFFLGFFETMVQEYGIEDFFKIFNFECSKYIKKHLPDYAQIALLKATPEQILNA